MSSEHGRSNDHSDGRARVEMCGVICPYQYDNVELAFGRAGQCGTVATSENELYQYHADCTGRR